MASVCCALAPPFHAVQGVEGRAQATEASLTNSGLCHSHAGMHITAAEVHARSVLQDCSSGAVLRCNVVYGNITITSKPPYIVMAMSTWYGLLSQHHSSSATGINTGVTCQFCPPRGAVWWQTQSNQAARHAAFQQPSTHSTRL